MIKRLILPIIILLLQLAGLGWMYTSARYGHADVPMAFIDLNILAVLNIPVLLLAYFCYFRSQIRVVAWLPVMVIAVVIILSLLIQYIRMAMGQL